MKINKIQLQLLSIKISINILFFTIIIFFGWISGKIIESIILLISFFIYRSAFGKEYHEDTITKCIKTTLSIFSISIMTLLPNSLSYVSPLIFGYLISYIAYKYQDYLDIKQPKKKKRNTNRNLIIEILGKDNLDEESIEKFCISKGLVNISETIYLFLNNKLEDVADILQVDMSTLNRRINKFINISKIKD